MKSVFCGISLALVFSASTLYAASGTEGEKKEKQTSGTKPVQHVKAVFTVGDIDKVVKEFTDKLKNDIKKGDRSISPSEFMMFGVMMDKFYKYPDVELETRVYRVWYKKLLDSSSGMCSARRYENAAFAIKQPDKAVKYQEEYKKYFNDFKNLIINKKKFEIPDDKLREIQKKKDEAEAKKKSRK